LLKFFSAIAIFREKQQGHYACDSATLRRYDQDCIIGLAADSSHSRSEAEHTKADQKKLAKAEERRTLASAFALAVAVAVACTFSTARPGKKARVTKEHESTSGMPVNAVCQP
jgi:hypothetical protein